MTSPIRVLICDDHGMVREALARMLESNDDIDVVASTASMDETMRVLPEVKPDIAVLDVRLADGNGTVLARWISQNSPGTKVIMLTSFSSDEALVHSYMAGASAFLLKNSSATVLTERIRDVNAGMAFIDPVEARAAMSRLDRSGALRLSQLDATDRSIVDLIAEGLSDKEISQRIHLSPQTIRNRVSRILAVLGKSNRTQVAVMVAALERDDALG
jgi:two-component system response regulator DevR